MNLTHPLYDLIQGWKAPPRILFTPEIPKEPLFSIYCGYHLNNSGEEGVDIAIFVEKYLPNYPFYDVFTPIL